MFIRIKNFHEAPNYLIFVSTKVMNMIGDFPVIVGFCQRKVVYVNIGEKLGVIRYEFR